MSKLLSNLSASSLATTVPVSQTAPASVQADPHPHAASPQLAAKFGKLPHNLQVTVQ
jgi:hypothetical protein